MNWISKYVSERKLHILVLVLILALVAGGFASWTTLLNLENARLERLMTTGERLTIEILSETHNSNLMGAFVFFIILFVGIMLFNSLKAQHHQREINEKLEDLARIQGQAAAHMTLLAEASVRLQRSKSLEALLQLFLKETHALFGTLQGVVYLCDDTDDTLMHLSGSFACDSVPSSTLQMGEGLLGQCALEKRIMIMEVGADGLGMIRSGLGEHLPECIYLAPILLNESLLGVIEVALLRRLTETEVNVFKDFLGIMAMNIEIVGRSTHVETLLTAMQATERASLEQLAFQQALIDMIPYPVFYKDAETRFKGVNKAYEAYFDVQREMLIGRRIVELRLNHVSEEEGMVYQSEDEAIIASNGTINREIQLVFDDGNLHDTLYSVAGFSKPDGTPGGLVGSYIDMSEIKQVKNDLNRLL